MEMFELKAQIIGMRQNFLKNFHGAKEFKLRRRCSNNMKSNYI